MLVCVFIAPKFKGKLPEWPCRGKRVWNWHYEN